MPTQISDILFRTVALMHWYCVAGVTVDEGNLSDCRLPWWSQTGLFTSVVAGGQKEYSRY